MRNDRKEISLERRDYDSVDEPPLGWIPKKWENETSTVQGQCYYIYFNTAFILTVYPSNALCIKYVTSKL